jgi:hypothetical protein
MSLEIHEGKSGGRWECVVVDDAQRGADWFLLGGALRAEDGGASGARSATKVMSVSGSGKRGRYVRQVTGRHNDTDLHVAARGGDAAALRRALLDAAAAVAATGEAPEDLEAARRAVAAEPNEAGETPLVAAAERGHLGVVVELLRHLDAEGLAAKNRSGYDALHVAAREGRHGECLSFSALSYNSCI